MAASEPSSCDGAGAGAASAEHARPAGEGQAPGVAGRDLPAATAWCTECLALPRLRLLSAVRPANRQEMADAWAAGKPLPEPAYAPPEDAPPYPPVPPGLPGPLGDWAEGLRREREGARALLSATGTPRFLELSSGLHGTPDAGTGSLARELEAATRGLQLPPRGEASVADACREELARQRRSAAGFMGEVVPAGGHRTCSSRRGCGSTRCHSARWTRVRYPGRTGGRDASPGLEGAAMSLVEFTDRDGDAVGIDAEDVGNVFACSEHERCVLVVMKESRTLTMTVPGVRFPVEPVAASTRAHLAGTTVGDVIAKLNAAGA